MRDLQSGGEVPLVAGGQVHYHHSHAQRCICSFSLAVAFQDGFILKIAVPFCFEIQSPRTELRLAQIVIVLISDGFLKKFNPWDRCRLLSTWRPLLGLAQTGGRACSLLCCPRPSLPCFFSEQPTGRPV